MAEFPAFPLWTDAYLADTSHLTTIEHGTYLLLLMAMWRAGGTLPNDDQKLARFARLTAGQWQRIKPAIMPFLTVSEDGLSVTQGRLADELSYVREHSRKQSGNARSRWKTGTATPVAVRQQVAKASDGSTAKPLGNNNLPHAMGMPDACQTDAPTPTPNIEEDTNVSSLSEPAVSDLGKSARKRIEYPADFEAAWQAYPRTPNMSKSEALPAWKKLSAEDRALVLPSIPAFKAYCAKHQDYEVIHFCRYLSKRRFEGFVAAGLTGQSVNWSTRLGWARANGRWSTTEWGPMPGQRGCLVPSNQLQPGDGAGWSEHERAA